MTDVDAAASPLEAVAGTVNGRTIAAFELLGSETRLAILPALREARDPGPPVGESADPVLSFSGLDDRVDVRDSGNFPWHLDKLAGPCVEETQEGYTLTPRAGPVLSAVLAGTRAEEAGFEGEPVGAEWFHSGGSVVIDYCDGILTERCTECAGTDDHHELPTGALRSVY